MNSRSRHSSRMTASRHAAYMHMLQLLSALREIYKHELTITHNKNYYRNNNTDRCVNPTNYLISHV